jgi:outer membrane protein TolC
MRTMHKPAPAAALAVLLLALASTASAQLSLNSAVDMAVKSDPRVKAAQANVKKALALLSEAHDSFIPVLTIDGGYGKSVDVPQGLPTIFSISTQSVAFNITQVQAVKAAQNALHAANLDLRDAQQAVEEDTVMTYLSLDAAQRRKAAMVEELGFATRLQAIVQDRFDAGQDAEVELLRAKRSVAQIRLAEHQAEDEVEDLRDHLARTVGMPGVPLAAESASIPAMPAVVEEGPATVLSPAIKSIFANAEGKHETAKGEVLSRYMPQLILSGNFSEVDTSHSQSNFLDYYPAFMGKKTDAASIGIQARLPLFDRGQSARAKEANAEAEYLRYQGEAQKNLFLEARSKLHRAAEELALRTQIAQLDLDLASQQVQTVLLELNSSTSDGKAALMTPKDEQNARLQERQRFIDLLEAQLALQRAQVQLMRQNGTLDDWLHSPERAPTHP